MVACLVRTRPPTRSSVFSPCDRVGPRPNSPIRSAATCVTSGRAPRFACSPKPAPSRGWLGNGNRRGTIRPWRPDRTRYRITARRPSAPSTLARLTTQTRRPGVRSPAPGAARRSRYQRRPSRGDPVGRHRSRRTPSRSPTGSPHEYLTGTAPFQDDVHARALVSTTSSGSPVVRRLGTSSRKARRPMERHGRRPACRHRSRPHPSLRRPFIRPTSFGGVDASYLDELGDDDSDRRPVSRR